MKTYIGIDFGTTHIKAGLFDSLGREIHLERVPTPTREDGLGKVYDPLEIREIILQLLENVRGRRKNPEAIVVTGMAEAGVMLDLRSGSCVGDILPWFDPRTTQEAREMSREEDRQRFPVTGLRNSFKYGIYKYRWSLRLHGTPAEHTRWLSAVDFILYILTGETVTDPTFAARTYAYSLETGDFDRAYLAKWGLKRENFPRLIPSGGFAGNCRLPGWEEVPVHIGGHDHICAAYGMSLSDPEAVCNSCGTAETYTGTLPRRPLTEEDFADGFVFGPFPGGRLFRMGNISSSGMAVEWYRKKLQNTEMTYAELSRALEPKGPTGVIFLPALSGMGTPCFRQDLRGAFLGLGGDTDSLTLLKAVVEGVCLQGRMILAPLAPKAILSVGGATQSDGWMQLKADILGLPVTVLRQPEATLTGAIALMLENRSGRAAAVKFMGRPESRTFQPDTPVHLRYEDTYRRYRSWYQIFAEHTAGRNL